MSSSTPSLASTGLTSSSSSACGTGVAATLSFSAWADVAASKAATLKARAGTIFFTNIIDSLITLFPVQPGDEPVAENLQKLHHYDKNDNRHDHDVRLVTLVSETQSQVAQPAAADHARHGRIAHQCDRGDDDSRHDAGGGLGNQSHQHGLARIGAHRAAGFGHARIELAQ